MMAASRHFVTGSDADVASCAFIKTKHTDEPGG